MEMLSNAVRAACTDNSECSIFDAEVVHAVVVERTVETIYLSHAVSPHYLTASYVRFFTTAVINRSSCEHFVTFPSAPQISRRDVRMV